MKKVYLSTLFAAILTLLIAGAIFSFGHRRGGSDRIQVGFIYESDESTPYTYNFTLAEDVLLEEYAGRVEILSRKNIRNEDTEEPLRELVQSGCDIVFTDGYSDQFREVAADYPDVQFCQASYLFTRKTDPPANYHTFKGEIYQGRYVSGIVAGLKLNEMIANRVIDSDEAIIGYVAAFPTEEIISGFTAFLMGVRSVCPDAVMHVAYTYTWSNFTLEKTTAAKLIEEGCRIIGQHTDTIGPAVACEGAFAEGPVYHVGYNTSMLDVAPSSSLISTCINWNPYILGAVGAVLDGVRIEERVEGNVHGNDIGAGFELDWVEMLELNSRIAAAGTQEEIDRAIEDLKKDRIQVFKGNYTGVSIRDKEDTIDLNQEYVENKDFSSPKFNYILDDVIIIDN